MGSKLAIVIPAFKKDFFKETLKSIANQTSKAFTLYIGDDASPYKLHEIVECFENQINIVYKKFDSNIGGTSLTSQWARCIDLTNDEQWIWLFSDDDLMPTDGVEKFYSFLAKHNDLDLIHFNLDIIDQYGNNLKKTNAYPKQMNIGQYFDMRTKFQINSAVVEYIFKKETYKLYNGFEDYDLAWCSDDATWLKFAKDTGIRTIPETRVKWRYSQANISSDLSDIGIVTRKVKSNIQYIQWATNHLRNSGYQTTTSQIDRLKWVISPIIAAPGLSIRDTRKLVFFAVSELKYSDLNLYAHLYVLYRYAQRQLKSLRS